VGTFGARGLDWRSRMIAVRRVDDTDRMKDDLLHRWLLLISALEHRRRDQTPAGPWAKILDVEKRETMNVDVDEEQWGSFCVDREQ
jgi:hypothetical protein